MKNIVSLDGYKVSKSFPEEQSELYEELVAAVGKLSDNELETEFTNGEDLKTVADQTRGTLLAAATQCQSGL